MKFDDLLHLWLPPAKQTLSEWAESNYVLSSEYSAKSGLIRLHPFQKGIFDAFTDPKVKKLVCMVSTQMVKTLLMQNAIAYTITKQPVPILLVEPTDKDARSFAKERLDPMVRDIESLGKLVSISGPGKDATLTDRMFPGGSLSLVGAGAAGNFKRRSIALLLVDEIDEIEKDVDGQGDVVALGEARLSTYGSRAKVILACSPTNEHESRIAAEYANSDQRQPWVACPDCGARQVLKSGQVKWDNTLSVKKRSETARYECEHCTSRWDDAKRWKACNDVEWIAQQPFNGVAGFWINHLYSPWHSLSAIVEKFLGAKDDWSKRKTFVNTTLAELWRVEGIAPDEDKLYARRETYLYNDDAVLPKGVLFLTAAVDVQQDRLECEVIGWGRDKESWSVAYEVVSVLAADGKTPLPTTDPRVWDALEHRILNRDWHHETGATLPIMLMAVDCGFNAQAVYDFSLKHTRLFYNPASGLFVGSPHTVVPVRGGTDESKIVQSTSSVNAARKREGNIQIVTIGTHCAKSELYEILRNIKPSANGEPVPNCRHFPEYNHEYFKGLCSEHRLVKANGSHEWAKKPNARNEPLDLAVYNRAAAELYGISRAKEKDWAALEARLNITTTPAPQVATAPQRPQKPNPPQPPPQQPRRIVGRFF